MRIGVLAGVGSVFLLACSSNGSHHQERRTHTASPTAEDAGTPVPPDAGPPPPDPSLGWKLRDDVPYARAGHAAIMDSANDRMIIFGGGANDTWALPFSGPDANRWTRLEIDGQLPPAHTTYWFQPDPAVYDEAGRRMLLFVRSVSFSDTESAISALWQLSLDGTLEWSVIPTTGEAPSDAATLAIDASGHRLFAVGNDVRSLSLDGTPTWSFVANMPGKYGGPASGAIATFDEGTHRLIVSGMSDGAPGGDGPWALSLDTNEWTQLSRGDQVTGSATVFDAAHERFVNVGGGVDSFHVMPSNTGKWEYAGSTPPGEVNDFASAVIDAKRNRAVYFGGETNAVTALDLDTFEWQTLVDASRHQYFASDSTTNLVWDPVRSKVVQFNGGSASDLDTRVRGLRPSDDWIPLTPLLFGATGAASVYDPVNEAVVFFGAYNGVGDIPPYRLGSARGASWQSMNVAPGPGARAFPVGIYDAANARMIVHGGVASVASAGYVYLADTWALTLDGSASWQRLESEEPSPPARMDHVGIYDPEGRRMLIYGGFSPGDDSSTDYTDLWALSLEGTPRWSQLEALGDEPGPIGDVTRRPSAVYDPDHRRMVVLAFSGVGAARLFALELDGALTWHEFCAPGLTPASVDFASNMVRTPDGLFFDNGRAAFRFNLDTPYCDH